MHATVIPPPPPLHRQSSHRSPPSSRGFRLLEDPPQNDQFDTGSIYSIYKQKIDKMFESDPVDLPRDDNNTVQARIERMFNEVAYEEGLKPDLGSHTFSIDYLGSIPLQEKVTSLTGLQIPLKELYFGYKKKLKHKSGLTGKLEISSAGLKVRYQGDKGDLEQLNPFPTIAVWSAVKFVLRQNSSFAFLPLITDPDNIDKKTLFQSLNDSDSKYIVHQSHAPLFTVVMRKIGLHKQLECHGFICQTSEDAIVIAATLYKSLMSHMQNKKPKNKNGISCMSVNSSTFADSITNTVPVRPPRKKRSTTGSTISESDTIANESKLKKSTKTRKAPTVPTPNSGSSNLNKSLQMDNQKTHQHWLQSNLNRPYSPNNANNSYCHSNNSNNHSNNSSSPQKGSYNHQAPQNRLHNTQNHVTTSQNHSNSSVATRNDPRSQAKSIQDSMDDIVPYEEPNCESYTEMDPKDYQKDKFTANKDKIPTQKDKATGQKDNTFQKDKTDSKGQNSEAGELKRTRSVRRRSDDGIMVKSGDNSGDILTKVTIPRSGSFLNAGGLTRYKSKVNRTNGLTSGGSPLGFSELFAEFRLQENLHSLDDILAAIVRPEGMSFNDLKPIYKEFLLKLAVTLTKDELYHRAKVIMRRKKRRDRKTGVKVGVQRLKRVFRKSFRLNLSRKLKKKHLKNLKKSSSFDTKSPTNAESSISTSSYDTRQFQPKEPTVQRKQSYRKRHSDIKEANRRIRRERMSTSEDSDFFTMKRRKEKCSPSNQNRNSSSGYVSCSECSYDSDTCTCISADKCYCSLGNRIPSNQKTSKTKLLDNKPRPNKHLKNKCPRSQTSSTCRSCKTFDDRCYCSLDPNLRTLTWCGCETDTCTESEKCYCQGGKSSRILEELSRKKQKKGLKPAKFDPKSRIFEELQRKGFFPTSDERINSNPGLKNSKKYKKTAQRICTDKYCYCPDNFCLSTAEQITPGPNQSYLHSKTNNNSYDFKSCQDCENCNNGTIFEQLQRRGFIPSCEEMTTPPNERKLCKKNSNTRSTKSVEYMHNPTEKYYEKLQNRFYDDDDIQQRQKRENGRQRSASETNLMATDLFSKEIYGRAMSEVTPRNGCIQNSVRSFKSFNGSQRRSTGKALQKSIPPSSSTEALSVKKSAEIAALFSDLKLSQTTDITHMLPPNSLQFPLNSQSSVRPRQFYNSSSHHSDKKAIVTPYKHISSNGKMVQNSLYQGRIQPNGKNGLYSARNGLYTIQSQSDSSCSDNQKNGKKNVSSFENTLGYLP